MGTTRVIIGALAWLLLTFAAAWLGARFLPDEWYRRLAKPSWNPPNWLFAPVWMVLYLLMATAAWLVWRSHGLVAAFFPLALYVVQLGLNAAWTWLFFGRHRPVAALADIALLWVTIAIVLAWFWKLDRPAGILMVPYLVWVSFAAVLNWEVRRLNPDAGAAPFHGAGSTDSPGG